MAFNPVNYVQAAYKNSPWVVISIAFHVVLAAVVSFFAVRHLTDSGDEKAIAVTTSRRDEPLPVPDEPEVIDRKSIPQNEEAEIVTLEEEMYIPTDQKQEEDLFKNRGDPTAADNMPPGATGGTSIGVGVGGHHGTGRASPFVSRRAGPGGGGRGGDAMQGTQAAVLEGLRWLIRHQNPDGSWGAESMRERCSKNSPCAPPDAKYDANYDTGLTGLALLCFLGAGYDNNSKQNIVDTAMGKRHFVGPVVKNGLLWLKDHQKEDGSFSQQRAFMYNEALAALAMTEAYGMTENRAWKEPAQRAINFLVNAQKPSPLNSTGLWGWRYASRQDIIDRHERGELDQRSFDAEMRDADTSVTCWVVMALKSAELSGLEVPKETMQGALEFTEWATVKNGMVGYLSPDDAGSPLTGTGDHFTYHAAVRSALGMLTRTFVTHNLEDPMLEAGAKLLVKDLPTISKDKLSIDYYYWYYGSLALNQFDGPDSPRASGKYWDPWNEAMKDAVLPLQDKTEQKEICSRGGWLIPDRWCHSGGPVYATAINVLTLEVYYRYGNAFTGTRETNKAAPPPKKDAKAAPPQEPKTDGKSNG